MVHPVSEGFFSDEKTDNKRSRPGERSRFKLSILLGMLREPDHRNHAAVEAWTTRLHEKLTYPVSLKAITGKKQRSVKKQPGMKQE
jgi:hypothetical protein